MPTDKTPSRKRDDISHREKEKEIQKDLDDGIDNRKENDRLRTLRKQTRHQGNVWYNTTQGRKRLMKLHATFASAKAEMERLIAA